MRPLHDRSLVSRACLSNARHHELAQPYSAGDLAENRPDASHRQRPTHRPGTEPVWIGHSGGGIVAELRAERTSGGMSRSGIIPTPSVPPFCTIVPLKLPMGAMDTTDSDSLLGQERTTAPLRRV